MQHLAWTQLRRYCRRRRVHLRVSSTSGRQRITERRTGKQGSRELEKADRPPSATGLVCPDTYLARQIRAIMANRTVDTDNSRRKEPRSRGASLGWDDRRRGVDLRKHVPPPPPTQDQTAAVRQPKSEKGIRRESRKADIVSLSGDDKLRGTQPPPDFDANGREGAISRTHLWPSLGHPEGPVRRVVTRARPTGLLIDGGLG
jgi:hypothetical protein